MLGPRGSWRTKSLAAALAGALAFGCAGDKLVFEGGRFVQPQQGFAFAAPPASQPAWQRSDVDHTLAAWTRPGGARLSVQSECGRNPPSPQVLARSLLIGIEKKVLRQSGPVAVGPWGGWLQVVDVGEDPARALHMKSVTLVAENCTVDFLLVARDDFAALEADFDRWWQSFEYPAQPAGLGS
jgi:hypothetical protein